MATADATERPFLMLNEPDDEYVDAYCAGMGGTPRTQTLTYAATANSTHTSKEQGFPNPTFGMEFTKDRKNRPCFG